MTIYGYGDSNMWGWDPRYGVPDNRLPEEYIWFERLHSVYGFSIINDSEPGRKIPGKRILRLFMDAVSSREWQILFLMAGTNDVLANRYEPMKKIGSRWETALAALTERFPDRKDRIVLSTLPYCGFIGYGQTVEKLRFGYQSTAEKYGVRFFDALDPLPTLYDGIHLSEEGHRILADRVAKYLAGIGREMGIQ